MMLPTHALAGMAVALPFAMAAPELAWVALLGGFLGGVVPDLDLYAGHRKTLHYPVGFLLLAVPALGLAAVAPAPLAVGTAFLLTGAALHSLMDVFGGGLELHPWEATSDHAVFDHVRGRWIAPRRWVRYDGAPEDLLLAGALAVPLLVAVDPGLRWLVVAAVTVAAVYTAVRRLIPAVAVWLVRRVFEPRLPAAMAYVPERYLAGGPAPAPNHGR